MNITRIFHSLSKKKEQPRRENGQKEGKTVDKQRRGNQPAKGG